MSDSPSREDVFARTSDLSGAETFAIRASEVRAGAIRLEGAFYGSSGYRAVQSMLKSGFNLTEVAELAKVLWFGPFSRTYVEGAEAGVPFLSSSEMMEARPRPKNFISRALTRNLQRLLVRDGTILVSCSGTIGNTTIWTADLDGWAVSQHAIRVIPKAEADTGLLYAFLLSDPGQFLVKRNKSGSVVESIYAGDVSGLPIPLLPRALRDELTRLVQEACRLRIDANRLLDEADVDVQRSCYLPAISTFKPKNVRPSKGDATVFDVRSSDRIGLDRGFGRIRLDAAYHDPVAVALAKYILDHDGGTTLGSVVSEIRRSSLRQRVYVDDPDLGVPMVGGKEAMQQRLADIKYLSRARTRNIKNEVVEAGWTLVTCGGTLGRTQFVHRNFERWCVSEHVMRIVPDPSIAQPGYVYAFMASPYGQAQVLQRSHGSVIPQIRDFEFESIAIRVPKDRGEAIHTKVIAAFDARADARDNEDAAIDLFMTALKNGRGYVESEWGTEY